MQPTSPARRGARGRRHAQRGLAALTLVALLLATGMVWLATDLARSRTDRRAALAGGETASLRQARQAIARFASGNDRLPCPAATEAGPEDCGAGASGWLPGTVARSSTGAARDAAGLSTRYDLRHFAGAHPAPPGPASGAPWPAGAGLCAWLRTLPDATPVHGVEVRRPGRGGEPQDAPSDPAQADAAGRHETIDAAALAGSLGCGPVLAALDELPRGLAWAPLARDARDANAAKASDLGEVMRMLLAHRQIELDVALLDLGAGLHALMDNQAKLQAALAASLAGIPPPPDAIPSFIKGIADATRALKLNALDIPRSTVSLALDAATLGRYRDAAAQARAVPVWEGEAALASQVAGLGLGAERAP